MAKSKIIFVGLITIYGTYTKYYRYIYLLTILWRESFVFKFCALKNTNRSFRYLSSWTIGFLVHDTIGRPPLLNKCKVTGWLWALPSISETSKMLNQCYLLLSALLHTYRAAGTYRDVGTGPHLFSVNTISGCPYVI